MEQFVFEVPGRPQGKGRPRASAVHGHARMRTPAETVQYENWIRLCYQQRYGAQRFAPPVVLEINAYFEIPKSYTKKKRELCAQGLVRPTCKPDIDNVVKAVADGLNGVAYKDDSGIVEIRCAKRWGSPERLVVRISGDLETSSEDMEELYHG